MPERIVNLPDWQIRLIETRARALRVSFDDALSLSLDVGTEPPLGANVKWLAERGLSVPEIAAALNYSKRAIYAIRRKHRLGEHG